MLLCWKTCAEMLNAVPVGFVNQPDTENPAK